MYGRSRVRLNTLQTKQKKKDVFSQDFFFVEVRREFSNWLWTWVLPWGENTGSWPLRDRTTEPKCLYRSLGSESGTQEVKQELLKGQQTHFPLYLLSYVNKSVGEVKIFFHLSKAGAFVAGMSCECCSHQNSLDPITTFPCPTVFHPHAKNLTQDDS